MKKPLTIFTPTYNRAYTLPRLYASLCRQTNYSFKWLIVDDGSTDQTEKLVSEWTRIQCNFSIQYYKQSNGGKQKAHNLGVQLCDTELFLCVDSDDYLTDDAVSTILDNWAPEGDNIAGIIALRGKDKMNPLQTYFPNIKRATLMELYQKYKFRGDTALVYRTDVLRRFPFYIAEGEKFIGENYVYDQIDQYYSMHILNTVVYICEYQKDGYTNNTINLLLKNPRSYMIMKEQAARLSIKTTYKIKNMAGYIAMGIAIKDKKLVTHSKNKLLAIVSYPVGVIIYMVRFRRR